MKILLMNKS